MKMVMVDKESSDSCSDVGTKPSSDPLCDVCLINVSKYRCPRCANRSCSLTCSKLHKERNDCSGVKDTSFDKLRRIADYSAATALNDAKFLGRVKVKLDSTPASDFQICNSNDQIGKNCPDRVSGVCDNDTCNKEVFEEKQRQQHVFDSPTTQYLLNNARRRRIWLCVPSESDRKESRHEPYSDTIFWSILMLFRREVDDGERVVEYSYLCERIPESISFRTLLKQFIQPKKIGLVVNRDELDNEKLLPFQDAGLDRMMCYMPVPITDKERYYAVDVSRTILDNLRNRIVEGHPTFIVTLDDQFNGYVMLSEQESLELNEARRQKERNCGDNFRGRRNFRGRSGYRGRFGGHNHHNYHDINRKRMQAVDESMNQSHRKAPWKRGRCSMNNYRGRNAHQDLDSTNNSIQESEISQNPVDCRTAYTANRNDPTINAWSQVIESKSQGSKSTDSEIVPVLPNSFEVANML